MTGVGSTMAFIRLEGIPALLLYVRRFADEIADPEEALVLQVPGRGPGRAGGPRGRHCGPGGSARHLPRAGPAAGPRRRRQLRRARGTAATMDYAAAREALAAGGRWLPRAWSRHASAEELAQAARDLLAEHDVRKLRAYLHLFRGRQFPAPASSLFTLVRHEDGMVASDAAQILGRLGGSDVRVLALELLDGAKTLGRDRDAARMPAARRLRAHRKAARGRDARRRRLALSRHGRLRPLGGHGGSAGGEPGGAAEALRGGALLLLP